MNGRSADSESGALLHIAQPVQGSGLTAADRLRDVLANFDRADRKPGEFDIHDVLRTLVKWKWLIVGTVAAGILLAATVTMLSTRVYRAEATISINTSSVEVMGNANGVQPRMRNEDQFLQTQFGLLKSRSLAERVARNLALGSDPNFVRGGRTPEARQLSAVFRLMGNFAIAPVRGSNLVTLGYSDPDPNRAMRIVNSFASGFIDSTTEQRYNATAFARSFLQNRLNQTRARLEESERQLVAYAQQKGIVQLDQGGGGGGQTGGKGGDGPTGTAGDSLSSQSLLSLNGALSGAINDRIAAEQRYRQALANPSSGEVMQDSTVQALRAERAKLEADYREELGTYQADYPDMVAKRARIDQIDKSLAQEGGDVASSLRSAYLAAKGREADLAAQVTALRGNVLDLRNRGIGYTILQRDVDTNRTLYDALLQRYKEVGVVGGLGESQAVVVDNALAPRSPYKPRPFRNLLIGLVGGLVIGLGLAFGIEFLDDTIKSPEDSISKLRLPVLGVIPRVPKAKSLILELSDSKSSIAEAYYSLMTALQFTTTEGLPKSILVTSSRSSEGKSSTSLALAQNFSRVGASVLLIDSDLRKPSFKSHAASSIGLSKLLTSKDSVLDHVVATSVDGLWLLPSGAIPPNPAELLASKRIGAILEEAIKQYDVVVIDAPPVLGLADAPILGSICEATLMVIEVASVRRTMVLNSLSRLFASNARVAGTVLTKFNAKSAGYGYGYGYGYGERYGGTRPQTAMLDVGQ